MKTAHLTHRERNTRFPRFYISDEGCTEVYCHCVTKDGISRLFWLPETGDVRQWGESRYTLNAKNEKELKRLAIRIAN
jgi:hypothetical protein